MARNANPLRVLIGCEFSGIVRRAFAARGHDAWSCDLMPAEDRSNRHIIGDIRDILADGWDLLMVAHPPCTRLCNSGIRWLSAPPKGRTLAEMWEDLDRAADLFSACWNAPIEHICLENPIMHRHAKQRIVGYRAPAQLIEPWHFGHPVFKRCGLYLKNLPPLFPTAILNPPAPGTPDHKAWSSIHRMPSSPNRARERSRFFSGVAEAMADQWGGWVTERSQSDRNREVA
jgi:hypothetical protein